MNHPSVSSEKGDSNGITNPRIQTALALLQQAQEAARVVGRELWEFAVEVHEFRAAGLTNTDLRGLLCLGYVQHAQEFTRAGVSRRSFQALDSLAIPECSSFVLTAAGTQAAARSVRQGTTLDPLVPRQMGPPPPAGNARPHWDGQLRRLSWQGHLIKQFRLPAANQEAILDAFEEQGWPLLVYDPLPEEEELEPKARLHDAIKNLNRNQVHPLLRFRGNGTGRGVTWSVEVVPDSSPELPQGAP